MAAEFMLARSGVRGRRAALAGLALLVALGLGTGIAAFTAAWRTEHAYADYLRDADVSEVVVNPNRLTDRISDVIGSTPGVLDVRTDSLLLASVDGGAPRNLVDLAGDAGEMAVRASADGRYLDVDRPVVHEGRLIASGAEAFLNLDAARSLGVAVGDELPLAFWYAPPSSGGFDPLDTVDPAELLEPIGRERVTVVGIGVFAEEVLADELYPRQRMLVTPEVAEPYTCAPAHPTGGSATLEQLFEQLYPPSCAVTYGYFSLRVAGGDPGVAGVLGSLASALAEESAHLPEALPEDFGAILIPAVTADERDRVARSLDPSVTALQLFGVAATSATLAVAVLALVRWARQVQPQARVWSSLGATRRQRVTAIALPLAACVVAGLAGAAVVGWLASGIGPVASARRVDPSPGLVLPWQVVLPLAGGSLLVLAAGVVAGSLPAARVASSTSRPHPSRLTRAASRTGNVALILGVRAALRGVGAVALSGAAVGAVIAVLGSTIFTTNLSDVVADPARFGWHYDAAAITASGYGYADQAVIARTLDRPEVESWGLAALGPATIQGESVPFVAGLPGFDDLALPIVEGALPVGAHEIALGAGTAGRLGLGVGDTATVDTAYGSHSGTVSGLVVLPPVGPILSDRAGLGTGVLFSGPFLEETVAASEQAAGLVRGELADLQGSFVVIDLAAGVDPAQFMATVDEGVAGWDETGAAPFVFTRPVRPAQIADVASMRATPALLAGLVALAMTVGLMLAIGVAGRTRGRELAVLRALGATGRQLRATLRWQALTIVGSGLLFGVPLGIALGRVTWNAFAEGLGIPPQPSVSVGWTSLVLGAIVLVGILASAVPGHLAARLAPSLVLRSE